MAALVDFDCGWFGARGGVGTGDPVPSSRLRGVETVSTPPPRGRPLPKTTQPRDPRRTPAPLKGPLALRFSDTRLSSGVLDPLGAANDDAPEARNGSLSRSLVPLCPQCTGTSRKAAPTPNFPANSVQRGGRARGRQRARANQAAPPREAPPRD